MIKKETDADGNSFNYQKEADYDFIYNSIKNRLHSEVEKVMKIKKSMKIQHVVDFIIKRQRKNEQDPKPKFPDSYIKKIDGSFWEFKPMITSTKVQEIASSSFKSVLESQQDKLKQLFISDCNNLGSEWMLDRFTRFIVACYTVKPSRASSYIPTPEPYNNAKCGLVNIQNKDNKCFEWCTKYHQTPKAKHDDRTTVLSKADDKYNYDNIHYPASFDDIKTFENNNKVCVNVYRIDQDNSIVLDYAGDIDYIKNDIIYLLRIEHEDQSHYVYIKHIQRLLNLNSYTKPDKHKEFCPYCNKNVCADDFFNNHLKDCYKRASGEGSLIKLPEQGSTMKFKNHKNKLERPYIVYADCESTLEKLDVNSDKKSQLLHKHTVNSCCFYFVCTFDSSKNMLKTFEGDNCIEDMVVELADLSNTCIEEMKQNEKLQMNREDNKNFYSSTHCSICNECFKEGETKCRDHDHRTGKFRGATHQKCNINYFNNRYLPVVFHNLRGYDSHLIIKKAYDISNRLNTKKFDVIPNSYEKFMSFGIGNLKFIDSLQFMASSLEKLVENLYDKNDKYNNFNHMKKYYNNELDLLCQKGFYPYEWVDNVEKLNHEGLPPVNEFYSTLSQETLSDANYKHAQNVYDKLSCKSFKDYHMTYLKTDVLLLADVFENFRNTCYSYYGLDPANYISAPSLAWDAMLMKTGIELEQIYDPKILDIIERHKKGGLCFVGSKRHVKANNHYLEDFDATKPENYLMYWDANNLYGWAMSQYLPYKNISLNSNINIDNILEVPDNNDIGYIIECDLEYPEEIHDKLKEFPPCPENLSPTTEMLSEYQKQIAGHNKVKVGGCSKLVPHLMKHEKYCIHYRNLKFIKELGIEITAVHNVVQFNQ